MTPHLYRASEQIHIRNGGRRGMRFSAARSTEGFILFSKKYAEKDTSHTNGIRIWQCRAKPQGRVNDSIRAEDLYNA